MDLGDSSNSEENYDPDFKRQKLDEEENRNQENKQTLELVKNLGDSSNSEGNQDPDPKRQRLDEEEVELVKNDSIEDEKRCAYEDFEAEGRGLFDSDSENEENNTWKREAEARRLLERNEESSESDENAVQDEESEEEEEDWKKGKTKEEQLQMMIDSFQNKHLFKSDDDDDLSEDEFGCHEMTHQEFVKYNFEITESGGFDVSSYPNVFSCGMIIPYHDPPRKKLKTNDLDKLSSFAQKALDKYNMKKNTNYCNMRVLKANIEGVAGFMYYVTFEASNDSGVRTFRAKIYEGMPRGGIPRIKISFIRLCK